MSNKIIFFGSNTRIRPEGAAAGDFRKQCQAIVYIGHHELNIITGVDDNGL